MVPQHLVQVVIKILAQIIIIVVAHLTLHHQLLLLDLKDHRVFKERLDHVDLLGHKDLQDHVDQLVKTVVMVKMELLVL